MKKKAISPVLATVVLVVLGLVLATVVYGISKEFLVRLSPPVDSECRGIDYEVDIYSSDGKFYLSAVSLAGVAIEGFSVYEIGPGTLKDRGVVELPLNPGSSDRVEISFASSDVGKAFLVSPRVLSEGASEEFVQTCSDEYAKRVVVGS